MTALLADPRTRVLHLRGERMPAEVLDGATRLQLRAPEPADARLPHAYLGVQDGVDHLAVFDEAQDERRDPGTSDPAELRRQSQLTHRSLRSLAPVLPIEDLGLATTAAAMANWLVTQRFCSRCGEAVRLDQAGWRMVCTNGHQHFPRTDAAVIMSVLDPQDRLLLAQGVRFALPTGLSVLAGFLEPGESLEAAVAREVMEEVGLRIEHVEYVGNQPWPMPASLMIGYEAHTAETELRIDPHEIRHARWFTRAQLRADLDAGTVTLPPRLSIARHLIERWYGEALPPQPGDVR